MRELSLFSGAGGGLLATKHLLGWSTIGYVENNEYCQRVIKARIADGLLDAAPIFGDIRAFLRDGYAEAYWGMVDVVTGGPPCQPASCAGKREGPSDPRWLWNETVRCVDVVRPRRGVLLENPPGFASVKDQWGAPCIGRVLGEMAEIGYNLEWDSLSSGALGADHFRERMWFVSADADREGRGVPGESCDFCETQHPEKRAKAPKPLGGRNLLERATEKLAISGHDDFPEPLLFRNVESVPFGLDRLRAIGNGIDPVVAATAWSLLCGE